MKVWDERQVILAWVDAERPPYPHEDFRTFRRARLAALESAYRIRFSHEALASMEQKALWMLFESTRASYLALRGPREGFLDDSLLNVVLERVDTPELKVRETEEKLYVHLEECREAHLQMLMSLYRFLFGPIETPLTSADLARLGFDDETEPKIWDYYDEM